MKTLFKLHVATAIIGWLFVVIASIVVLPEGGLAAFGSLCLLAASTAITAVDIFSVLAVQKNEKTPLPILSFAFWGIVLAIYGYLLIATPESWQGRAVFGVLIITAMFKIYATAKLVSQ